MGLTCIKTHKPSLLWNVSCFYEWVLSIVDATCCQFLATEMAERHDAKAVLQIARGLVHRLQDMIENKWFRRLVTTPTHLASAWNFRCQDNFSSFVHSDENFHSRNSFCLMHNDWNFHGWSFRHCGGYFHCWNFAVCRPHSKQSFFIDAVHKSSYLKSNHQICSNWTHSAIRDGDFPVTGNSTINSDARENDKIRDKRGG